MLPRLICAATLGLSMLTRVQAVCRAVPYLTRFGSAAASASEVINYLPTDSSPLQVDFSWATYDSDAKMYNGCQTDDTFVAFGLYTYEDTGPFVDLSNSPIAGGTGGRYVATLPIARNQLDTDTQYFVAYETGAQLASYGMLALIGHRPSQYATFTFIDSQPTAGILKRRLERESRGESVPYHVHCQQGQTACHLGGTAWECVDTQTDLESCGGCPLAGGINCIEAFVDNTTLSTISCVAGQCRVD